MVPDEELLITVLELKPVVCLWLAEEDGSKIRRAREEATTARSLELLASNDDGMGAERDTRRRSLLLDGESEVRSSIPAALPPLPPSMLNC